MITNQLTPAFQSYTNTFVQRLPRYGVKFPGKHWRTKKKSLSDVPVLNGHLAQKYYVGCIGRWYPEYAVLDIDSQPIETANEVRNSLGLNSSSSMLFSSESENSFHILLKPVFNDEPMTIALLQNVFRSFAKSKSIEIYPQANRFIRLPFGKDQIPLDLEYRQLENWQKMMYWFDKIDPFEISSIPGQQTEFILEYPQRKIETFPSNETEQLINYGLQARSTRHDNQFKIISYLHRCKNMDIGSVIDFTFQWIKDNHNGYSTDIIKYPAQVKEEIIRQANWTYGHRLQSKYYPNQTNNSYAGYLAKADIKTIFEICQGSMPKSKFLFNLLKYCYPRKNRSIVNVHSDKLITWSSIRTYKKYLNELESKGISQRGKSYMPDAFSKNIKLNWKYRDSSEAILYDGRSVHTLESTLRMVFKPEELRELLTSSGAQRTTAIKTLKRIY